MNSDEPMAHLGQKDELLYLYGIVRRDAPLKVPMLWGGTTLGAVVHHGLAALVETVSAAEFSPEVLEVCLAKVDWVARVARKHETTLEAVMLDGPVIPARLCTLFTNEQAVQELLENGEDDFAATLERIDGAEEWGVKVYCNEAVVRNHAEATDSRARGFADAANLVSPGQAHVLRKKRDARILEVAAQKTTEVSERVLDEIETLDVETCLRPLLLEAATERKEKMVLNVAVLVNAGDVLALGKKLDALAQKLVPDGFILDRCGPFPPYSFTRNDEECSDDEEESS
jgi:hypothetical protein